MWKKKKKVCKEDEMDEQGKLNLPKFKKKKKKKKITWKW